MSLSLARHDCSERLHGLDALRGFALLLGIVLHASMSYLPGSQFFWIISDSESSLTLNVLFFWIHSFRMTLFFLIAGYFGRLALLRLGLNEFLRDRRRRIVMPLLIGWPILFSAIVAAVVWAAWVKHGGSFPQQSPPGPRFTPDDFPLAHLWFLYVLVLLYAGMLLLRGVVGRLDNKGWLSSGLDTVLRVLVLRHAWPLLLVPVAIALYFTPQWYMWFGIPTPDKSLYPNLTASVAYGLAFAVGWALHRQPMLLSALTRHWHINLMLALAALATCLWLAGPVTSPLPAFPGPRTLGYAAAYAVCAWAWSFALIGMALRFASGYSPARRYLADASYWMYLVHLPLVMAAQVLAFRFDWPWWIEAPLILLAVTAVLLLSYHYLVRNRAIGAMLKGRRRPSQPAAVATTTPTAG